MIHPLSRATTYLQTYFIHAQTGKQTPRSRATGFFVRANDALLLVTNWHVVTGIDPVSASSIREPAPHFLKVTVASKNGFLTELSLPLYGPSLEPLWEEHPDGGSVDIAIYPLPFALEKYFNFVDIHSVEDDTQIAETVAKDVFIIGYPFGRDEMREIFGSDAPYYVPVWKRGSIASEPALRLGRRVLLIDSLSRPGMSGAPIVIAKDVQLLKAGDEANAKVLRRIAAGENDAIMELDTQALTDETVKHFRFLGVYSGVIGNTRLNEVALGVCWHVDTLRELVENSCQGAMPFHAPEPNEHLSAFLAQFAGGELTLKNVDGEVVERASIRK